MFYCRRPSDPLQERAREKEREKERERDAVELKVSPTSSQYPLLIELKAFEKHVMRSKEANIETLQQQRQRSHGQARNYLCAHEAHTKGSVCWWRYNKHHAEQQDRTAEKRGIMGEGRAGSRNEREEDAGGSQTKACGWRF